MGHTIDGVQESKTVCKYYQTKLAWQREDGTTHLNQHYKKNFDQTWSYWSNNSGEKCCEGIVNFVVGDELSLSIVDNKHFTRSSIKVRCGK